ncbi:Ornithine decarboxylase 1 [Operophtera brumata]|uniref:ornithine decarboxylase n=1 Tax=Operophtera brumata TaxID=104452 RepID=A0A0L7KVM6_OPEBR|nr:Ornithine decarboxylase 1 [Operophtera brumata]
MEPRVRVMHGDWSAASVIEDIVSSGVQEDPFYVMDLGELVARYQRWTELMPRVEPFYAVKCNDDRLLVSTLAALGAGFDCASRAELELVTALGVAPDTLAALGAGFDCASRAELELVTALGVAPDMICSIHRRIIFANPAKMASHIRRAAALRVSTMTFDSETELLKIKHLFPSAQLVLRIRCDAASAQCPLGMKFGCNPVVGISFHVGSGAGESAVYERAILAARQLFDAGAKLGHSMRLLDVGGGFAGGKGTDIFEVPVKCNDDRLLVSTLAALGAGFDCASRAELELVTALGVAPERIIFANPAKMASHIRRAAALRVSTMTFDSETELLKIKHLFPSAQLVLRIRCDAASAQCPLGMKFGCNPVTEAPRLLKLAALHQLNVVGISFHVGSGAGESAVYERAILAARQLFDAGAKLGHSMRLLDVGGGFAGGKGTDIFEVSQVINGALSAHFADASVRVIAEPGRYFAAAAYTLAAMVVSTDDKDETHTMYFINDGVYGSFNCILYDHQQVVAIPLKEYLVKIN